MNEFERRMAEERSTANARDRTLSERSAAYRRLLDEVVEVFVKNRVRPVKIFREVPGGSEKWRTPIVGTMNMRFLTSYFYLGYAWPTEDPTVPADGSRGFSPAFNQISWYSPDNGLIAAKYTNTVQGGLVKSKESGVMIHRENVTPPEMPATGNIVTCSPGDTFSISPWLYHHETSNELARFANSVIAQGRQFD